MDARPWRHLDSELAEALSARLEDTVALIAEGVAASVPDFATIDDPRFHRDVHRTTRVAITRFVQLAGTDQPALTPEVREAYLSLGAAEAREERGPEGFTAALRAASRLLLRQVTDARAALGPISPDQVVLLADAIAVFSDELVATGTEGFARQVRELAGEQDRLRLRLMDLLVQGAPGPAVHSAAASIGWTELDRLTPLLLPRAEGREARFRFGADGLVAERGEHVLAVLRGGLRSERDLLGPRLGPAGVVLGPTVAWSELPSAVRLTEHTGRVTVPSDRVVRVEDRLVTLALHGEPSALALLVRRRLAPFDALPGAQRDSLLRTLAAWLRHWGARDPVARELFVHPQTVSYRIRRVRELLGDDLDDPQARLELALALTEEAPVH